MQDDVTVSSQDHMPRIWLMLAGALGGLSLYMLVDNYQSDVISPRLYLALALIIGSFFGSLLALTGPLSMRRALIVAAGMTAFAVLLNTWAGFRFDISWIEFPFSLIHLAFVILVLIALPFAISIAGAGSGWRDYPTLFNQAWGIVTRGLVALIFVGLFWGVIWLSTLLFNLVGLTFLEEFLKLDAVPFLITGGALGLAVAVTNELTEYVSPYLVFRLLRLLLPIFVVVVLIFVLALPFRGLDGVFRGFSEAVVLMCIAIGGLTLITVAIGTEDGEAVSGPIMRGGVLLLGIMLPIIAGLATYAVWLRVGQYGWTPERLLAMLIAGLLLLYGLSYAVIIVLRGEWMGRLRQVNILMALVVLGVCVLWQTPLLNAERISAQSQLKRFTAGLTPVADLDLWTLGREWGRPGAAVVEIMRTMEHDEREALDEQLASLDAAEYRHEFRNDSRLRANSSIVEDIMETLPVFPEGERLAKSDLERAGNYNLRELAEGCARRTAAGNVGCVVLKTELLATNTEPEFVILYLNHSGMTRVITLARSRHTDKYELTGKSVLDQNGEYFVLPGAAIDAVFDDEFTVEPTGNHVLKFEDGSITMSIN